MNAVPDAHRLLGLPGPAARVRPMHEDDLAEVIAIEEAAYAFPWTAGIFRDCLRVGYSCWVLDVEARVAGYGILSVAAGESHLLNLCIEPDFRRRGFGRQLLAHLTDVARAHRADSMFLEVRPSNGAALDLYRSMGFNEVGMRRAYYPAEKAREDAVILGLALGRRPRQPWSRYPQRIVAHLPKHPQAAR